MIFFSWKRIKHPPDRMSVNNTTTGAKLSTGEEEPDAGVQVRRSSRVPKSNTKYYGKMWTR